MPPRVGGDGFSPPSPFYQCILEKGEERGGGEESVCAPGQEVRLDSNGIKGERREEEPDGEGGNAPGRTG